MAEFFRSQSFSSRCAIRGWYICADANHLLCGVLRHGRRSDMVCLLGTLDGSPNLADWTNVVLVVPISSGHCRGLFLLRYKALFSSSILNKIILDPIRSFIVLICV